MLALETTRSNVGAAVIGPKARKLAGLYYAKGIQKKLSCHLPVLISQDRCLQLQTAIHNVGIMSNKCLLTGKPLSTAKSATILSCREIMTEPALSAP